MEFATEFTAIKFKIGMEYRIIKFRAWDTANDKMYEGGWSLSWDGKYWYDDNNNEWEVGPRLGGIIPLQFTGFVDKNDVEIYEGDLIKINGKIVATVVYQNFGGWSFKWVDPTYITIRQQNPEPFFLNISLFEVAGNIYEHAHLLSPTLEREQK